MRLRRLDLLRYGHFEDACLDFGPKSGGTDVTVVFGPNEAGKSTAFTAWLDLLYGFAARNPPYAFLFDRKDLLVGAQIEVGDSVLSLRRTAKKNGSLCDADGRELPDHMLSAHLYGLDREAYRNRFSLNDDILRSGGEEIAAAKGDLGRLLHAGTSGLSGLSQALDAVQADIDSFYQKGGSKQIVPSAKRRLKELDAIIRDSRLAPARHHDLLRAVQEKRDQADAARDTLARARRDLAHAKAATRRRSLRAERQLADTDLKRSAPGPDLPPGAVAEVAELSAQLRDASRREIAAKDERDQAAKRLEALVPDPQGLELGPVLDVIQNLSFDDQPLLLRASGADADLARRRARRKEVQRAAEDLCRTVLERNLDQCGAGLDDETFDRLDAGLRSLAEAQVGLDAATEALADERTGHGDGPPRVRGDAALSEALQAMDAEGPDLDTIREDTLQAEGAARRAAEGLAPQWRDLLAERDGLPADETLADCLASSDRAVGRLSDAERRLDQAQAALDSALARLAAAEDNPDAIDRATLQRLRAARDADWAAHRASLDAASADRFESAMRDDDAATAAHAAGADARADLMSRRDDVASARAAHQAAERDRDQSASQLERAQQAQSDMAARVLLPTDAPAPDIRARRAILLAALDAAKTADAATDRLSRAQQRHDTLSAGLSRALAASDGAVGDLPLVSAARRHLEALRKAQAARAQWQDRQDRIATLAKRVDRGSQVVATRRIDLERIADGTWAAGMEPAAIRSALPGARKLAERLLELRDLSRRIASMEDALRAFESAAERPRQIVGPHDTTGALMEAARDRHQQALIAAQQIAEQTARHGKAEDAIREAKADQTAARARIAELLAGQPDPGDTELSAFVQGLAERDRLRADMARIDADLERAGEGLDPARLAEEETLDDPARVPGLEDAVAAAEAQSEVAARTLGAAEQALRTALDATGAVAADQERAALIEDLRAGARDVAARMIGVAAARAALSRLGERRRGPMLRDTEAAFTTLTGGAWSRLDTWRNGRDERLVGVTEGRSVPADGMSTGTRAQLYLALRIAGHAAFVQDAGPLPFVTDDILESFDDDRAAAALDLTAELGRRGQAILFTHHAHLVDMARERIADARIIELAPRAGSMPQDD